MNWRGCKMNKGASETEIVSLEEDLGVPLPTSYRYLLSRTNGVEGFVTDDAYLVLWSTEQVAELNSGYSVAEFAPGLTLIGSNGGNIGYALDNRSLAGGIVEVPLVGMSLNEARNIGASFEDFLRRLSADGQ